MSFTREAARGSVQQALYDVGKAVILFLWVWLTTRPRTAAAVQESLGMTAREALAWLAVVSVIVGFFGLFLYDWWRYAATERIAARPWNPKPPSKVKRRKKYRNTELVIDGSVYEFCRFDNVTLMYRGTQGCHFQECQFGGETMLQTDNPAAKAFLGLAEGLRQFTQVEGGGQFLVAIKDDDGHISPFPVQIKRNQPKL